MKNELLKSKKPTDLSTAKESLNRLQRLPLEQKIALTERRIKQYYDNYNGKVYVSFSGGKDSTVLLNIIRGMYPKVPAVFSDTGLEYPEIRDFVKTINNVSWVTPKISFNKVIENEGFPVVSKKVAKMIRMVRENPESKSAKLYLSGITSTGRKCPTYKIPKKWLFLINAPFKISEKCCYILKQRPLDAYAKECGSCGIMGTMASDSYLREKDYLEHGCNIFNKKGKSRPLSFWTESDVWEYLNKYNIPYSKIYDMGEKRTGCIFCLFGRNVKERFERMSITHPKQYKYCMEKLGIKDVLSYIEENQ